MSIVFDAASGGKTTGASSLTFSHTCNGADRVLFVGAGFLDNSEIKTVTGVTYATVPMTNVWTRVSSSTSPDVACYSSGWVLVAPATGANNVVITYDSNVSDAGGCSVSVTGANQTTPTGTPATAATNGVPAEPATVNVSSASDELVVDFVMTAQPTVVVDASQTSRNEQENINFESSCGSSTEAGAGTVTMSWTMGAGGFADEWAIGAVSIKQAGIPPTYYRSMIRA